MNRHAWHYLCQEENGPDSDDQREPWLNPEEVPEDDSDDDEEMDEM